MIVVKVGPAIDEFDPAVPIEPLGPSPQVPLPPSPTVMVYVAAEIGTADSRDPPPPV